MVTLEEMLTDYDDSDRIVVVDNLKIERVATGTASAILSRGRKLLRDGKKSILYESVVWYSRKPMSTGEWMIMIQGHSYV